MAIDTDKLKDDAAGILNLLGKITPVGMAKSLAEKLQGNQAEVIKVIKKLLERTPPGQAAQVVKFIVDRYKIPESIAARMVANEMTDPNEGFGPQGPDGTPDDGYRKNIGIDSGAEDYYDVPDKKITTDSKRFPNMTREMLTELLENNKRKVTPLPRPRSERFPDEDRFYPEGPGKFPNIMPELEAEYPYDKDMIIEGPYDDLSIPMPMLKQGGRVNYAEGTKMASDPDPMDERNNALENLADSYFGKPLKDLTPKQIEFLEEALEEMSKKPTVPRMMASAPDPMDERNTVMENIAIDQFGKPLKDLSEEEIIQIEEMMDEMSIKKDRGAPSIKLAAEGGIMRVGLKDGTGKFEKFFFNKESPILSGLNTSALFDLAVAAKDFVGPLVGLAEGGRIGYKDGPSDPTKRKFIKAAVGLASVLPFGIGKGVKMAAPVVAKAAEITGPALAKIVETVMDFGKLISVKGRRVKEMVTKKKHQGVEVTEDISDGSYIIKKDNKEIYYKPGRMDETGGVEDDIIEILEDTVTKKAGGGIARMLGE